MDETTRDSLRTSYDAVGADYASRIAGELDGKPFDRERLCDFADRLRGAGTVADLGCGPGHVAAFLADRGLDVVGIDLSPGMIAQARALHPALRFRVGDLTRLDLPDGALAGAVAFYSLIHVPRSELAAALREVRRALTPGGLLLAAVHIGDETLHLDEWWGHPVSVDFTFFTTRELTCALEAAGFAIVDARERDPYAPEVEHQSRRAYVLARA